MSYNIRNVEGGNHAYNDLTFEYDGRQDAVVNYILAESPDVIGIQEASVKSTTSGWYSLSWFDYIGDDQTPAGLTANGYACYKGQNILPSSDNKEMYNPIYYKTSKYEFVTGGFVYLSDDNTQKAYSDEYKGATYVVLKEIETGIEFVYVNVHMTRNFCNAENCDHKIPCDNYQDDVAGYLRTFVEDLATQYNCPIIIGGDFNGSYSVYTGYDEFWGTTAVKARDEAANKTTGCSTTNSNFDEVGDSSGAIDLYYAMNTDNVDILNYAVTDNKVESTGKYPSDHLPVKLVVTFYGDKAN